jgi:hypothetical protein
LTPATETTQKSPVGSEFLHAEVFRVQDINIPLVVLCDAYGAQEHVIGILRFEFADFSYKNEAGRRLFGDWFDIVDIADPISDLDVVRPFPLTGDTRRDPEYDNSPDQDGFFRWNPPLANALRQLGILYGGFECRLIKKLSSFSPL